MAKDLSNRLDNIRVVNPVLTNLAQGYHNGTCIAKELFPEVEVEKESGTIPLFGRESFILQNTERQIRGKSNRVDPKNIGGDTYELVEHDLEYPMDKRELKEAGFDLKVHGTAVTKDGIDLKKEFLCSKLACDPANYADTNKVVLSGTDQFDHPDSDPVAIINTGKSTVKRMIGREANVMMLPQNVFDVLIEHPNLLNRQKATEYKTLDIEDLQKIFKIKKIVVGDTVYVEDYDEDDLDSMKIIDIWKDDIVLAYVAPPRGDLGRTVYDASYAYMLKRKASGLEVDEYVEVGGKVEIVRTTEIVEPKMMSKVAGYLIKNAVSSESTEG